MRGEFDVFAVSLNHCYFLPKGFDDRGIVGEEFRIRLSVGFLQQGKREGLWRLNKTIIVARSRDALAVWKDLPNCLDDWHDRHNGFSFACRCKATLYGFSRNERTHAIVHANHCILIIWKKCQAVLDTVEARFATSSNQFRRKETVVFAKLLPVGMLLGRQYKHNLDIERPTECLDGVHQYRFPANWQKLLWHVSAHTKSFATCNDDNVFVHFSVNSLYIMP